MSQEIKLHEEDIVYLNRLFDRLEQIEKRISALSIEKHKLCEGAVRIQDQYDNFRDEMIDKYNIRGLNATVNLEQGIITVETEEKPAEEESKEEQSQPKDKSTGE